MINDVSGASFDPEMAAVMARSRKPGMCTLMMLPNKHYFLQRSASYADLTINALFASTFILT